MTYSIRFYLQTDGSISLHDSFDSFLHILNVEWGVRVDDLSVGNSWWSGHLCRSASLHSGGELLLEVHFDPELINCMIDDIMDLDPPRRVGDTDAIVNLTISGNKVDWSLVRSVWSLIAQRWSSIPFAEGPGFDITINSLP